MFFMKYAGVASQFITSYIFKTEIYLLNTTCLKVLAYYFGKLELLFATEKRFPHCSNLWLSIDRSTQGVMIPTTVNLYT